MCFDRNLQKLSETAPSALPNAYCLSWAECTFKRDSFASVCVNSLMRNEVMKPRHSSVTGGLHDLAVPREDVAAGRKLPKFSPLAPSALAWAYFLSRAVGAFSMHSMKNGEGIK